MNWRTSRQEPPGGYHLQHLLVHFSPSPTRLGELGNNHANHKRIDGMHRLPPGTLCNPQPEELWLDFVEVGTLWNFDRCSLCPSARGKRCFGFGFLTGPVLIPLCAGYDKAGFPTLSPVSRFQIC